MRRWKDRFAGRLFFIATLLPIGLLVAMIVGLAIRAQPLAASQPIGDLLFGQIWLPSEGRFGFWPFIMSTLWVTVVAMVIAVPACLLSALYLSEYAGPRLRALMKPLLDILAAIPSVVYGVWGLLVIVPFTANVAAPFAQRFLGFIPLFRSNNTTGYSVFSAGLVLAVMVTPVIVAVTYEVLQTVPQGLREASLAMGATMWQTIKFTLWPKALPGIISRAFGETIAVMMVVGNVTQTPTSIFDPAYPLPALIANNYGEMMSIPMYDSALLGAALILLLVVLGFNLIAMLALRQAVRRAA